MESPKNHPPAMNAQQQHSNTATTITMMRTVLFFFGSSTGVGVTGISFMISSPYNMGCGKQFVRYELKT
jgi:hypothetical protein